MIILISGKSGSGKTFIAQQIAPYFNAKIISFDEISHQVLEKEDVLITIRRYFGSDIFENQTLNRKKLGKIVFNDPEKLEFLNDLCQTQMELIIDEILKQNLNQNFILDYALLPKMKYFNEQNIKILVKADPHLRKTRIISRDKISEEYFIARDENSLDYNESEFDIIINNNEDLNIEKIVSKIKENLC